MEIIKRTLSLRTLKRTLSQGNLKKTLSLRNLKRTLSMRTLKWTLLPTMLNRKLSLRTLQRMLSLRTLRSFKTLNDFCAPKNSVWLLGDGIIQEWVMRINFHIRILILEGLIFMLQSLKNWSKIIFIVNVNAAV